MCMCEYVPCILPIVVTAAIAKYHRTVTSTAAIVGIAPGIARVINPLTMLLLPVSCCSNAVCMDLMLCRLHPLNAHEYNQYNERQQHVMVHILLLSPRSFLLLPLLLCIVTIHATRQWKIQSQKGCSSVVLLKSEHLNLRLSPNLLSCQNDKILLTCMMPGKTRCREHTQDIQNEINVWDL